MGFIDQNRVETEDVCDLSREGEDEVRHSYCPACSQLNHNSSRYCSDCGTKNPTFDPDTLIYMPGLIDERVADCDTTDHHNMSAIGAGSYCTDCGQKLA